MRFLTANWLFPIYMNPIKQGVLCLNKSGQILDIISREEVSESKLEIYNGILCPGFVNTHCHLELSHLKKTIKENVGFIQFAEGIKKRNNFSKETIKKKIIEAEEKMKLAGIVGVGDICNTTDTLFQKEKKVLEYYNFIEIFQVQKEKLSSTINQGLEIRAAFREASMKATLVPHSCYSVIPELIDEIENFNDHLDNAFSFHNQETKEEEEFLKKKSGPMFKWLKHIDVDTRILKKENPINSFSILDKINVEKNIILVHNVYTSLKEIEKIESSYENIYWCTCPKSNLYINSKIPNYDWFRNKNLCIGTDSLASNHELSILEEIKIISSNSSFSLHELLFFACYNGAKALDFSELGSFEKNKKPGVNLIKNLDALCLTEASSLEVIL